MVKEDIVNVYQQFRNSQKNSIEIEHKLLDATNEEDWIKQLSRKSTFLRLALIKNETLLHEYIYPILEKKVELTDDIAIELLNQVINMEREVENDSVLTTNVLKLLKDYFNSRDMLEQEILTTFYLGVSYGDRVYDDYFPIAFEYFNQVCSFKDLYLEIESWEIRKRILFAQYNRLVNYRLDSDNDPVYIFTLWNETKKFLLRDDIRELDKDNMDFDYLLEECESMIQWNCSCDCLNITDELLKLFNDNFNPLNICESNICEYSSIKALSYLWYQYNTHLIDCNKAVSLLFKYYCENNKTIDYTKHNFYEQEQYYTQCVLMEQCFKYIAKQDCTLPEKIEIRDHLIHDFDLLYKSVPYLQNNTYLNIDMIEILHTLLTTIDNENDAFVYIKEVIVRRNVMTLIHSTMLSRITELIVHSLISRAPELFFSLLKTTDKNVVLENEDYLIDYITKASYLHDIGKIRLSDIINLQTRKLADSDFNMIKFHPTMGANIIRGTFLEEKYMDLILGHHKFYDGSAGYPNSFNNVNSSKRILIDILTIGDCIEAATDTLGRNYTIGKIFIPTVIAELKTDNYHRYNKDIVNVISQDKDLCDEIQYITGLGRVKIYFDIYQTYLEK